MRKLGIIAEIGWNHMGNMELAEEMILAAQLAGATTVKFQFWDPELLRAGSWDTDGRREIYNKAKLSVEHVLRLKAIAEKNNCEFLISVFGTKGARKIFDLGIDKVKIPSHEIANRSLLKFCSLNFKEVIVSSGASKVSEVKEALSILRSGQAHYNIMHCVSAYPCKPEDINLPRINWLKSLHNDVGFSDHTGSTVIPVTAVCLGCNLIEKHFTTDKSLPGRDNKFALNPKEFKEMVLNIREAESGLMPRGEEFQFIERDIVENYRGRWEPHDYEKK